MIEPISYGWKCPCCGRVYNPRQEMCLYCGPNEKGPTVNNLGDWISTNPYIVDTQKEPTNISETHGTLGSPFYTTTTGSIGYKGPVQEECPFYRNGDCLGVEEPYRSVCPYNGNADNCSEVKGK